MAGRLKARPGAKAIDELNPIEAGQGRGPPTAESVSAGEGRARVVTAGSNTPGTGEPIPSGDDIGRPAYPDDLARKLILEGGDTLRASTGAGAMGECCVRRSGGGGGGTRPGAPEGHVPVIRVDPPGVYPEFLRDRLRTGFGHDPLDRLHAGSTGVAEVTPDGGKAVVVPPPCSPEGA